MPSYRTTPYAYANNDYGSSFSVSKQSGTVSGDWILIWVPTYIYSAGTASCSGFTAKTYSSTANAGTLLYRQADGSEGSSFSVSLSNTSHYSYIIATIAGDVISDPSTVPSPNGGESSTITANSITLSHSGTRVLWFAGASAHSTDDLTVPSGFTLDAKVSGSTLYPRAVVGHKDSFSAGSTGSQSISLSASDSWEVVMVGFASSSVGATASPGYISARVAVGSATVILGQVTSGYVTTASGISGAWSNVANAEGATDAAYASWSVVT